VGTVTERLGPGDLAPEFALSDADGKTVSLASYEGKRVVVYFYPAAMTPGCTIQACDFRDNLSRLSAAGLVVIGISPDPPDKLAEFRDHDHLTFPLLSDPDTKVMRAYGAYGENQHERIALGVIRSTFVIGPNRRIEHVYYNVQAAGHVDRVLVDLGL
jgi:thioredoxin-dependent peroxiredoxin